LALMGLRQQEAILQRNMACIEGNLALLKDFFRERTSQFEWHEPAGSSVALVGLTSGEGILLDYPTHLSPLSTMLVMHAWAVAYELILHSTFQALTTVVRTHRSSLQLAGWPAAKQHISLIICGIDASILLSIDYSWHKIELLGITVLDEHFPRFLYYMMLKAYKWILVELQVNLLTASVSAVSERQGSCSCLDHNLIMSHQTISVTHSELASAVTISLSAWSNWSPG